MRDIDEVINFVLDHDRIPPVHRRLLINRIEKMPTSEELVESRKQVEAEMKRAMFGEAGDERADEMLGERGPVLTPEHCEHCHTHTAGGHGIAVPATSKEVVDVEIVDTMSSLHPHEPEVPRAFDEEGRCRVCGYLAELDRLSQSRDELIIDRSHLVDDVANLNRELEKMADQAEKRVTDREAAMQLVYKLERRLNDRSRWWRWGR